MASAAQRRIKSISYAKYGYMFIAPFFLVYCFFQIWPLIQTFILSFQGNGADAGTFVGFDNYATILFGSGEGMGRISGKGYEPCDSKGNAGAVFDFVQKHDHSVVW